MIWHALNGKVHLELRHAVWGLPQQEYWPTSSFNGNWLHLVTMDAWTCLAFGTMRQLWCQVHKQRWRQALDCKIKDNVHINRGLDRRPVLRNILWLGLRQQNCWHLHAGVHQEENTRIWTSCSKKEEKMPLLPRTQKVWFQRTIPPPTQWYAKTGCKWY